MSARDYSTVDICGVGTLGIAGQGSKAKGKKGSAFALGVYNADGELTGIVSAFIDGENYKEDTYYCVKDGALVEWKQENEE